MRVGGEVLERLLEPARIARDPRRASAMSKSSVMLRSRSAVVAIGHPLEQIRRRRPARRRAAAAAFEPRQVEQVADDRFELVGLLLDDRQIAAARVARRAARRAMPSVST